MYFLSRLRRYKVTIPSDLPLAKSRLAWLSILLILCIVTSALAIKMITKHNSTVHALIKASPPGVSVDIDYNDAKVPVILLFIAANVATTASSNPLLYILLDIFSYLIPLSIRTKYKFLDSSPKKRLSNATFLSQFILLVVSFFFFLGMEGYLCSIVFKRSAKLIINADTSDNEAAVQDAMNMLGIVLSYRHTSYISIVPKVAPAAIAFIIPSAIVTARAWYLHHRRSRDAHQDLEKEVQESVDATPETSSVEKRSAKEIEVSEIPLKE